MKANDKGVPADEMLLAKLIQNAASRGLKSIVGSLYENASGQSCLGSDANLTGCCAVGAAYLASDTLHYTDTEYTGLVNGNDTTGELFAGNQDTFTVGQCFNEALSPV